MAAKNHLNPKQLKLFMTPQEVMDSVSDSVDRSWEYTDVDPETGEKVTIPEQTMDELWEDKLFESTGKRPVDEKSLYDSIKDKGVQRHVTLQLNRDGSLSMGQGHHRVAAAADIAKKTGRQMYIPVLYDEDYNYSDTGHYYNSYPEIAKLGKWDR